MSDVHQKPLQCLRCVLEVLFDRELETPKTRFFVGEGSLLIATLVRELTLFPITVPTREVAIREIRPNIHYGSAESNYSRAVLDLDQALIDRGLDTLEGNRRMEHLRAEDVCRSANTHG